MAPTIEDAVHRRLSATASTAVRLSSVSLLALLLAGTLVAGAGAALAQPAAPPDSAGTSERSVSLRRLPPDHTPRKALYRALAVPGWGQFYNRQFIKVPVVLGGLGGFVYGAVYNQDRYTLWRDAEIIKRETGSCPTFAVGVIPQCELKSAQRLRDERDLFRRNRDLLLIGSGLFYGLSVLDAYVSAHLVDFDVSETLTLSVEPRLTGARVRLLWHPR